MLEIKPIMDSAAAEIFAFKCACGVRTHDQNLEIHVTNRGESPVVVSSHFDLEGDAEPYRVRNLMPHGQHKLMPRDTIAFYCDMDDARWEAARRIVFYDDQGNRYPLDISSS